MYKIVICLKSGKEFTVICEDCVITRNKFGDVANIRFEGTQNINPIILNVTDIALMYEVLQTENDEQMIKKEIIKYLYENNVRGDLTIEQMAEDLADVLQEGKSE